MAQVILIQFIPQSIRGFECGAKTDHLSGLTSEFETEDLCLKIFCKRAGD